MTAFDKLVEEIANEGMHNHRSSRHSDILSEALLHDLVEESEILRGQLDRREVSVAYNWDPSGGRGRGRDLVVGPPGPDGAPIACEVRMVFAHKTVITAHRNTGNRVKELLEVLTGVRDQSTRAVLVATFSLGTASRYLNVPDKIKSMYYKTGRSSYFDAEVLPRVGSGDATLWTDFAWAISENKAGAAAKSLAKVRALPMQTEEQNGFDSIVVAPLHIDNVDPPRVDREREWAEDFDKEYRSRLHHIAECYRERWG